MRQLKGRGKIVAGNALLSALVIGSTLLAACQSTPAASPTAAPAAPTKAAAAPTAAPAAAPAAATAAPATAAAKEVTVKIGHLASFTGSMAAVGEPQAKGWNDLFQWVNDQGGIAYKDPKTGDSRAKLTVTTEDIAYDATRAINVYQRLKGAGATFFVGYGTVAANALAETVSKDKIPALFSASPSDTTLKPSPRYMATNLNPMNYQTAAYVKYIKSIWKESRAPRLGLAYLDSPAGQLGIVGIPEYAKKLGFDVLTPEAITEPLTDSSIQVKRLLGAKPDYIFAIISVNALSIMMRDAARLGVQGDTKWATIAGSYDPMIFQKVADAETNGVMGWVYRATPSDKDVPGVKLMNTISQKYQKADITNIQYLEAGTLAQIVTASIKGGLEKVGADALTGEAIRNAMFSLKDLDLGGVFPA